MFLEYIQIFIIGVLEDFLSSFNTKTIQRNNQAVSFVVSFISVILWYWVIVKVVDNVSKFWLIIVYACGGGFGDIFTIRFDKQIQRFEKRIATFLKAIRRYWPLRFKRLKKKKRKKPNGKKQKQKIGRSNPTRL